MAGLRGLPAMGMDIPGNQPLLSDHSDAGVDRSLSFEELISCNAIIIYVKQL